MNGDYTVSTLIDTWQGLLAEAMGPKVGDIREAERYISRKQLLDRVFTALKPFALRYVAMVLGRDAGTNPVEQAAATALCFWSRLAGIGSVDVLEADLRLRLEKSVCDTFFLGMANQFALASSSMDMTKFTTVNAEMAFSGFLQSSIVADRHVAQFYKACSIIPHAIFDVHYARIDKLMKHELRVGLWKRGKIRANYHNVYSSGILLPMMRQFYEP